MKGFLKNVEVFLLVIFFGLFAIQPNFAEPSSATPVGRVVWVKGIFKAIGPDQKERTLKRLSLIYLHDTLITGNQSSAQIAFTDDTLMTFRPDSKFEINQYQYQPKSKKGASFGRSVMNLIEGGFRTITGLIAKNNPKNYQINTPVATIGVRGTDYTVALDKGELFISYYRGMPCVKGKESGQKEICLDDKNKYVKADAEGKLQTLTIEPDVLKQKLIIVPAKISSYGGSSGGGGGSNFCILQ